MTKEHCNDCYREFEKISKCKSCNTPTCNKCLINEKCKTCTIEEK